MRSLSYPSFLHISLASHFITASVTKPKWESLWTLVSLLPILWHVCYTIILKESNKTTPSICQGNLLSGFEVWHSYGLCVEAVCPGEVAMWHDIKMQPTFAVHVNNENITGQVRTIPTRLCLKTFFTPAVTFNNRSFVLRERERDR